MAKKKTQSNDSEENLKEKCPGCLGENFSIEKGPTQKRFCQICNKVWTPLNLTEVRLGHYKEMSAKLQAQVAQLKEENQTLKAQIPGYKDDIQAGIFQ